MRYATKNFTNLTEKIPSAVVTHKDGIWSGKTPRFLRSLGSNLTSWWWKNQPIPKICGPSNWIISPRFGLKIQKIFENHHLVNLYFPVESWEPLGCCHCHDNLPWSHLHGSLQQRCHSRSLKHQASWAQIQLVKIDILPTLRDLIFFFDHTWRIIPLRIRG